VDKRILTTDSLSNIVAQERTFTRGNSKKMVLKDLMAEEGSNLKLMWVPKHVGIKRNEKADKAAKDWSKWVKRKSWLVKQEEWKAMVKPNR
jgi:ribonuclease HI